MNIEISDKKYEKLLNYHDALLYCELLVIDGKNDWRMPTKEELDYICESKNDLADLYYYWTSTVYDGDYMWVRRVKYGTQTFDYIGFGNHVRAVRSLEDNYEK